MKKATVAGGLFRVADWERLEVDAHADAGLPTRGEARVGELLAVLQRAGRFFAVDRLLGRRVDALETDRRVRREVDEALDAPFAVDHVQEVLNVAGDEDAHGAVRRQSELVVEVEAALPRGLQAVGAHDTRLVRGDYDGAQEGRETASGGRGG